MWWTLNSNPGPDAASLPVSTTPVQALSSQACAPTGSSSMAAERAREAVGVGDGEFCQAAALILPGPPPHLKSFFPQFSPHTSTSAGLKVASVGSLSVSPLLPARSVGDVVPRRLVSGQLLPLLTFGISPVEFCPRLPPRLSGIYLCVPSGRRLGPRQCLQKKWAVEKRPLGAAALPCTGS